MPVTGEAILVIGRYSIGLDVYEYWNFPSIFCVSLEKKSQRGQEFEGK